MKQMNQSDNNQKSDANTSQQVLAQVEQQYNYVNGSNVELIIVNKELSVIDNSQLNVKLSHYATQKRIIERALYTNILLNKDTYFECLNTLEACQIKVDQLNASVRQSRRHIEVLKTQVTHKSKQIYVKLLTVQNLQKSITQLQWIHLNVYPITKYLQDENLQTEPFLEQLALTSQDKSHQVLMMLQSKNYHQEKLDCFILKMSKILGDNLENFKEEQFKNFMDAYTILEQRSLITSFNVLIPKLMFQTLKQTTNGIVTKIQNDTRDDDHEEDNYTTVSHQTKLRDRVKTIQNISELIKHLYHQYISMMVNIHLMIRSQQHNTIYWQQLLLHRKTIWQKINSTLVKIWTNCDEAINSPLDEALLLLGYTVLFTNFCFQFTGSNSTNLREIAIKRFQHYIEEQHTLRYRALQSNMETDQFEQLTVSADRSFGLIQKTSKIVEKLSPDNPIGVLFKGDEALLAYSFQQMFHASQTKKLRHIILGDFSDTFQSLKYSQTTYFLRGKVRNIQISTSGYLVLENISFFMMIVGYAPQKVSTLMPQLLSYLDLFIMTGYAMMTQESTSKQLQESNLNVKYDEKVDFDYYTNQFDYVSEVLILQSKFSHLKQFVDSRTSITYEGTRRQFDLKQRITYIESLRFLVSQLDEASNSSHYLKKPLEKYWVEAVTEELCELILQSHMQSLKPDQFLQGLALTKWDQKMGEKDIQQHSSSLEKIAQFIKETRERIKQSFDAQTMNDFTPLICDSFMSLLFDHFSKVRKVSGSGREQMISDYASLMSNLDTLQFSEELRTLHEEYLKIFNTMQQDMLIEYVLRSQKVLSFKQLINLVNLSPVLLGLKKIQKRDLLVKMFKYYQDAAMKEQQQDQN